MCCRQALFLETNVIIFFIIFLIFLIINFILCVVCLVSAKATFMALPTSVVLSGLSKEELDNELDEVFEKGEKLLKSPLNETPSTSAENPENKKSSISSVFSFEPSVLKKIFSPKSLSAYFDLLTGPAMSLQGDVSNNKESKEEPLSKHYKDFNVAEEKPSTSLSREWPPLPPIATKTPGKTPRPIQKINSNQITPPPILSPEPLTPSDVFLNNEETARLEPPPTFSFPTPASTAVFSKEVKDSVKIMYEGKDILDLAGNLRWSPWQAQPSAHESNSFFPQILMFNDSSGIEQYKRSTPEQREIDRWKFILSGPNTPTYSTRVCEDCGFEDPLTYY